MLKSIKKNFVKTKPKDEQPPAAHGKNGSVTNSRAPPAAASGASISSQPSASRPATAPRERPALPVVNDQTMAQYYAEPLPSFRDVQPSDKQYLFIQKLHLCCFTFDFADPTKHVREKEIKRQTLLELVDYTNTGQGKFTEAVSEDVIYMLSCNLFRSLPPTRTQDVDNFDPEEEEPMMEPAWPHLQVSREAGRVGT